MTVIFNRRQDLEKRRLLRQDSTETEKKLWEAVRRGRLGYNVRRQASVGAYVVDFYVPHVKLVIEVDGGYHLEQEAKDYDQVRQQELEAVGIHLIRFTDQEVGMDVERVVTAIKVRILDLEKIHPKNL